MKAAAPAKGEPEGLLDHLIGGFAGGHAELEAALTNVRQLAERRSFVTAAKSWGAYRILLERHIASEELLLASLETLDGCAASAGEARRAHRRLKSLMGAVGQALSEWSAPSFSRAFAAFEAELATHWRHESEALLRDCRRALADPRARERVRQGLLRI